MRRLAVWLAATALVVGACSSGDDAAGTTADTSAEVSAEATGRSFEVPAGPGGVVTIAGERWVYAAEFCSAEDGLAVAGPGVGPDGTAAWVDVSLDTSTDFDADGQSDTTATVVVQVGRTDLSMEPSGDLPDYYATSTRTGSFVYRDFEHLLEGGRLTGSGKIQDYNGIALSLGETADFTFDVGCT